MCIYYENVWDVRMSYLFCLLRKPYFVLPTLFDYTIKYRVFQMLFIYYVGLSKLSSTSTKYLAASIASFLITGKSYGHQE